MAPSDRSIQQTAGDGATQIGEVHGNVYIDSPAPEAEIQLDLDAYREHQRAQLANWERQYTRLDVNPAVALAGQDLRPLPDSRLSLTEAFIRHDRLVVVGGAGAGKTTSMLFLVASVLPGGSLAGRLAEFVPVHIELGQFRAQASRPLANLLLLIAETLSLGKPCPPESAIPRISQLLESHRFIFLLDALNEANAELRASCLTAIKDLAKHYPANRFVLSSRPHGFSPPQGWEVVHLRELEDKQISEFVGRYLPKEATQTILQTAAQNPLLRIPLFLYLVVEMSGSPHPDDQRRLRSRFALVREYAEHLLARGAVSSAEILTRDDLRGALDRLAQATQTSGQVLSLAEARHAIESGTTDNPEKALKILTKLCEQGLLATNRQSIRFWHQTIQEYFYAGSVVRRWRGSKKQVGRMPWWLRRLAAKPEEEEALSFMVAHLCDEEMESALHFGLSINPALVISWADDLCLAGQAVQAMEYFPARVHRFTLAARCYAWLGKDYISGLAFLSIPLSILGVGLLVWLTGVLLRALGLAPLVDHDVVFALPVIAGIFMGCLPLLDALRRSPSARKLESLLGAIPELRATPLREALTSLAREVSHSKVIRQDIRALAQGISAMKGVTGEELIRSIRASEAPYTTIRVIGRLDTPFALPLLKELLKLNNFRSRAALEALALRADRLRDERKEIRHLLLAVWRNEAMDIQIRRLARKLLLRAGENPGGRGFLLRYDTLQILKTLVMGFSLVLMEISLAAAAHSLFEISDPGVLFLALLLGLAALLWWDARRLGARTIIGSPANSAPPFLWALICFSSWGLLTPLYLLNRPRIRRDAVPVDWDVILQAIQAKGPHGDNLSIAHPPSAPSPR